MAKLNLVSPWDEYYNKMDAFFADDPGVQVLYDEEEKEIKVLVGDSYKAEALTQLLVPEQTFGNVTLKITVIPANTTDTADEKKFYAAFDDDWVERYKYALSGNDICAWVKAIKTVIEFNPIYVMFKKRVIQYFDDNIGDFNGVESTLAENIARDIFVEHPGVYFCTDVNDPND